MPNDAEEEVKKEKKSWSIRLPEELKERIENILSVPGVERAAKFAEIIESYEHSSLLSQAPAERRTELAGVNTMLRGLHDAFANSVHVCSNAEARIREELRRKIEVNETAISAQNEQIRQLRTEVEAAQAAAEDAKNAYNEQCAELLKCQSGMLEAQERASNAQRTINALTEANEQLRQQLEKAKHER